MHGGEVSLRLKRFEAAQRALKVSLLETMIRDLDNAVVDLSQQIAAEEERTKIKDTGHFAYSTLAKAAAMRRSNLLASLVNLKPKLEVAKRELEAATKQLRDLESIQTPASSIYRTITSPSPTP
jgi:hypothetical protein